MTKPVRTLALASGGGHWTQLMRLRPAFEGCDVAYVSMFDGYAEQVEGHRYYRISDASRFAPTSFIRVAFQALGIIAKERPRVIVTTGSAPMLLFLLLGRLIGARSLWIDSMANSERMSSSGRLARKLATKCVSQWTDVANKEGVESWGRVL